MVKRTRFIDAIIASARECDTVLPWEKVERGQIDRARELPGRRCA